MNRPSLFIILSVFSVSSWGTISPEVMTPSEFNQYGFIPKRLKKFTMHNYTQRIDGCNDIVFKQYAPPSYVDYYSKTETPDEHPITRWLCLYAVDVYNDGYDAVPSEEDIFFDEKTSLWKLKKNHFESKKELNFSLRFYDVNNIKELHPILLYNIKSVNAQGYAVIDRNISKYDLSRGIKGKKISFCLMHDGAALCGFGGLIKNVDGVDVDFTPYILKSLETIEMGVKNTASPQD